MKPSKLMRLSNQREIAEYVKNKECSKEVRLFALGKIFEKSVLLELFTSSDEEYIREECIKKLWDYDFLFDIAVNDSNWRNRLIAISQLTLNSYFVRFCEEILIDETYRNYSSLNNIENILKNDENWKNRLVAALIVKNHSVLEDVARNDECKYIRIAAVFSITNEDTLIEIIKNDEDNIVVDVACKKLDDESALIEIYRNHTFHGSSKIKPVLIRNIHDQFFLISEIYGSIEWAICREASDNIHDHNVLYDLMVGDNFQSKRSDRRFISYPDHYVYFGDVLTNIFNQIRDDELQCEIANVHDSSFVKQLISTTSNPKVFNETILSNPDSYLMQYSETKLINDDVLYKLAHDSSQDIRFSAVSRIFDKKILSEIIKTETDDEVKSQAIFNLNIESKDVNLSNESICVRGEAIKSITDEQKLVKISCYDASRYLSQIALNNIDDDELLADFACECPKLSRLAINKIRDEKFLAKVAIDAPNEFFAVYALSKITDESLLVHVMDNSPFERCYRNAVSGIENEEILNDIAYNFRDDYTRKVAVSKITSQDILKDLALNDLNRYVRVQAVENISDENFLKEISQDDDPLVRFTAKKSLKSNFNISE